MHYSDVIMSVMASQITSLTIVHWTFFWDADQRKHQSSASLAFVREIHRWPVNFSHKWPVTWKMFPFDDVIMCRLILLCKKYLIMYILSRRTVYALQWRHDECDGISNHQPHDCLLNHLFRRRSKKTSEFRITGLCEGNSQVTREFPA